MVGAIQIIILSRCWESVGAEVHARIDRSTGTGDHEHPDVHYWYKTALKTILTALASVSSLFNAGLRKSTGVSFIMSNFPLARVVPLVLSVQRT